MSVWVVRALLCVVALAAAFAAPASRAAAAFAAPASRAAAAIPLAAAPAAEAYVIRLTRPAKVGDRFAYTADATVVQTLTANMSGQTRTFRPRTISVHFEGTELILAVSPRGEPTRAEYRVTECTAREGKQQITVVQPGRVVTVEAGKWKPRIDVDQGAFTIQDSLVVGAVLSLPNTEQATDDECFGTDKAQKVGDAWPVRPDPVVRSYAAAPGLKPTKQNVSGTIKVAGVETVDGVVCVKVQGKTKIEHFLPPATDLPEKSKVQDATFEYKFTKLLPVDQLSQCVMDSHSSNVQVKVRTDDASIGSDILVEGKFLRTVGIRRRPLKE